MILVIGVAASLRGEEGTVDFVRDVRPIFAKSCYSCHGAEKQKSGYRLDARAYALKGGEIGRSIVPGDSAHSPLIQYVAGTHPEITMPPKGERLTTAQVATLRAWIDQGASWPADVDAVKVVDKADWWSLKPIVRPPLPPVSAADAARVRNPIDAFVLSKVGQMKLRPAKEADRRTLCRRLYFDLIGLPPTPEEVDAFVGDADPQAYEKLVDRLLASPRYGEKWGRHWLDVVHYGDTHGYDKDKVRPNAWPYRDYVIRAFNEDKPYDRFVKEQLAGDALYPGTADGVVALGFIAAGPWDFVGQVELREGTIDKQITRNLDRDDMVQVSMNTFASLTAQCARCHNHKFDPILQEDYYALQAVFAGVDRADRPYEADPAVAQKRLELQKRLDQVGAEKVALDRKVIAAAGPEVAAIDARLATLATVAAASPKGGERPEFGYHSQISKDQSAVKWVQVDLGISTAIDRVLLVGCHDTFANIGAGFGFPVRYKVEIGDDPAFGRDVITVVDHTDADVANPGVRPVTLAAGGRAGRYVRVTATKLAPRQNDYIFALAELGVLTADGTNAAAGRAVTALDSIEAPPRWRRVNLVDGYYYGIDAKVGGAEIAKLSERREALVAAAVDAKTRERISQLATESAELSAKLAALPQHGLVYAAKPIGKPRPIFLLNRGSEKQPREEVGPGTVGLAFAPGLASRFIADDPAAVTDEARRRADLAKWLVDEHNPLSWRSIVNRVWQYHFGRGIVESANDFGHMGALPSHAELLDWLASEFRDGGAHVRARSVKSLTRLIVTSSTYRQSCAADAENARIDGGNQYLWRMNRAKLDAEDVRDSILSVAGKLDLTAGGPGYMLFGFKDDHSPHYAYAEHDPDDVKSLRRSVYRMVVRSVPDPFMETLDCADPSQIVAKRNETLTALQALALMNDRFAVRMAGHFAERVGKVGPDMAAHVEAACRLAYGRGATELERRVLVEVAERHGLASACRVILNSNEFVFVD